MKKYRSLKSLQKDLRKTKNIPDYITYKSELYEMSFYDMEGKYINWDRVNNLDKDVQIYQAIEMLTEDRYGKTGTKDAVINLLD